jgi:glycosyltransferase involved in cell wall biosynthesis
MPLLSVVIPVRQSGNAEITLASLQKQTFKDFQIVVSPDKRGNANWARNHGFERCSSRYVLFSDDDIKWEPDALQVLVEALEPCPRASYSYGAYRCGKRINSGQHFNSQELLRKNYISTMSVIRSEHFPGFDESLQRLQDWDLWLTMLEQGHVGVFCGRTVFSTEVRPGITHNGKISWHEAERIVRVKHGL